MRSESVDAERDSVDVDAELDSVDADAELESPYWRLDDAQQDVRLREIMRRLPVGVRSVAALIVRAAPRHAVVILVLQVGSGLAAAFGPLATTGVLDGVLAAGPTVQRMAAALPALATVVVAFTVRGFADTGVAFAHARVTPAVRRQAEGDLLAACLRAELAAFDDPGFYDRMQRARDRGVYHITQAVDSLVELVSAALGVVAAGVSLAVLHPALLPVLLLGVLPRGWAVLRSARLHYGYVGRTVTLARRVQMVAQLATERESAAEIRACQAQDFLGNEYTAVADPLRDQEVRLAVAQARTQATGRVLVGLATAVTFLALALLLRSGAVPLAVAGTALIAVRTANAALARLVLSANQLFELGLYVTDYQRFLAEAQPRPRPQPAPVAPRQPRRIGVRDVDFRYPGNPDGGLVLRGVNLTVETGQTVALVGENGSGKTTLAKIIAGLYAPTAGRVEWDGMDIADLEPRTVADRVMMVLQNPVRWPHTARANVRVGRHDRDDPGDVALHAAAGSAGADDVVAGLANGWNTLLSKYFRGGHELSGGQWQRMAVARGLFRDAPLLIWDEPTAPLDAKAEFAVYESLRRVAGGRTVILITHRLASVRNCDQIYLLHDGELAERGTHDELIADGGRYAELYALQEQMFRAQPSTCP